MIIEPFAHMRLPSMPKTNIYIYIYLSVANLYTELHYYYPYRFYCPHLQVCIPLACQVPKYRLGFWFFFSATDNADHSNDEDTSGMLRHLLPNPEC